MRARRHNDLHRSSARLADRIRAEVLGGRLLPGAKLDSVRRISQTEKCGQPTVVEAVQSLVAEGLLETRRRHGVYVADSAQWRPVTHRIAVLTGVPPAYSAKALRETPHLAGMEVFQDRMARTGGRVSVHGCVFYPFDTVRRAYIPVKDLGVEGADALVAAAIYDLPYLASLLDLRIPVVAYDLDASGVRMDSAFFDDVGSAFALTKTLLARGHRAIAFAGGPLSGPRRERSWVVDPCAVKRADGYRMAMREAGLAEHVHHLPRAGGGPERELAAALQASPGVTAVLSELVPGPAALPGRAVEYAFWNTGPVTTWPAGGVAAAECDVRAMGEATAELVLNRLKDRDAPVQRRAVHPTIRTRDGAPARRP